MSEVKELSEEEKRLERCLAALYLIADKPVVDSIKKIVYSALASANTKEGAELKKIIQQQDEIIGRLTRENQNLQDTEINRNQWLEKAKAK